MTVCVVLVSYKGVDDTVFCLHSLRLSSVPVQVVVVDTTPFDQALATALEDFPEAYLLQASSNLGFGRGNNLGLRWALEHTSCDFIFILNNDASVTQSSIAVLLETMHTHPEIGIVTPRIVYRHHPETLWYGGGEIDWRRASVFTPGFNQSADAPEALRARLVTFASGCAIFVRRQALITIGGFDPRFFMYEEDVEWSMRAREKGYGILYEPAALILHRAQGGSREGNSADRSDFWDPTNPSLTFYAFHIIRNRLLNVFTHATPAQTAIATIFFPLYVVRRAVPFLRHNRADAVLAMLRGAADSWKSRKLTQPDAESDFTLSLRGGHTETRTEETENA